MISVSQLRAARGLLGWSDEELAGKADVPLAALRDYEEGRREMTEAAAASLKHALEQAGVEFTEGEAGVSLLPEPKIVPLEKLNASNDE